MSSRRQILLARVNWCLQSSFKRITVSIPCNRFYHRGGRYRQVSLYCGVHAWNKLPINIKAAESLYVFKSLITPWPGPKFSNDIQIASLWQIGYSYSLILRRKQRQSVKWLCRPVTTLLFCVYTSCVYILSVWSRLYLCICIWYYLCIYSPPDDVSVDGQSVQTMD